MPQKDFIKKVSIKEDFVLISDIYVDLGKVIHVQTRKLEILFTFLGGETIGFGSRVELDETVHPRWHIFPDVHILLNEEFDLLLDFVKQRFGGKEIT